MKLTVLTWNIHKGIGGVDRRYRPDRIVEVLSHHHADIALLQEVTEDVRRAGFHKQVHLLGDAVGYRHRIFSPQHVRKNDGLYGNAILSRWPLYDEHHVDLTIGTRKKRGVCYAKARIRFARRTRTIGLYNLHLGLAGSERQKQLWRFLESHPFTSLHKRTPVILGGDLNDLWGTLGPKLLEPAGFRRAGKLQATFPAALPVRPLDGIFVRGDIVTRRCAPSKLALARRASDHLPLVAQLQVDVPAHEE